MNLTPKDRVDFWREGALLALAMLLLALTIYGLLAFVPAEVQS